MRLESGLCFFASLTLAYSCLAISMVATPVCCEFLKGTILLFDSRLLYTCYVPDTVLNALRGLTHLNPTKILQSRCYYYFLFVDRELRDRELAQGT